VSELDEPPVRFEKGEVFASRKCLPCHLLSKVRHELGLIQTDVRIDCRLKSSIRNADIRRFRSFRSSEEGSPKYYRVRFQIYMWCSRMLPSFEWKLDGSDKVAGKVESKWS
jgi:hypothetical protein